MIKGSLAEGEGGWSFSKGDGLRYKKQWNKWKQEGECKKKTPLA